MNAPAPLRVLPGMQRIELPMPAVGGPASVNAYLLGEGDGAVLVDTGWDTEESWHALLDGLASVGSGVDRIGTVVATHVHRDHRGLAERIRAASGARIALHAADVAAQTVSRAVRPEELDAWQVPASAEEELRTALPDAPTPIEVDLVLQDGEPIAAPGRTAQVVHTPGHTPGSICLLLDDALLTGDTLLPGVFPGLGLAGGDTSRALVDYRRSLDEVGALRPAVVLPGHGPAIADPATRISETLAHHARRTAEVQSVLADAPGSAVWAVAQRLTWSAGWDGLIPRYRVSALRQTAMHIAALA